MTLRAVDAGGNTVAGYSGTVNLRKSRATATVACPRPRSRCRAASGAARSRPIAPTKPASTAATSTSTPDSTNAPGKNGTSDPFTVHPGTFARVQLVGAGREPLPGQRARQGRHAQRASRRDRPSTSRSTPPTTGGIRWRAATTFGSRRATLRASTPVTGAMTNGPRSSTVSLGTVGHADADGLGPEQRRHSRAMTSPAIQVMPSGAAAFDIRTIAWPLTAGVPVVGHDPCGRRIEQHDPRLRGQRDSGREHRPGQHLAGTGHVHGRRVVRPGYLPRRGRRGRRSPARTSRRRRISARATASRCSPGPMAGMQGSCCRARRRAAGRRPARKAR